MERDPDIIEKIGRNLFGPFEGHLLGCESTTRQLIRISLQQVGNRLQGAAYPLSIPPPQGAQALLRPLVAQVSPTGSLLIGSVHDSAWGAGRNVGEIVKLKFHGNLPTGIAEMRSLKSGFELLFTQPIDPVKGTTRENYVLTSYRRLPTSSYGGPNLDTRTERIVSLTLSKDARRATLILPELRIGFVYALRLRNLSMSGQLFHPAEAYYSMGPLP